MNYTKHWEKKMWRNETPSLGIMDSQAVKNTDNAKESWFCFYKCTNGIKRHLLVDVFWIPLWTVVTTADISDKQWAKELWELYQKNLQWIATVLMDNGYAWDEFKKE